jgi:hypothetical protein
MSSHKVKITKIINNSETERGLEDTFLLKRL